MEYGADLRGASDAPSHRPATTSTDEKVDGQASTERGSHSIVDANARHFARGHTPCRANAAQVIERGCRARVCRIASASARPAVASSIAQAR